MMRPRKSLKLRLSGKTQVPPYLSSAWCIVAAIIVFLVFANDGMHHWDDVCFLAEAQYGREAGFRCLWFDHFRLHLALLDGLVAIFGAGLAAFEAINFIFALLMGVCGILMWYLLKAGHFEPSSEIPRSWIVALFLFMPTSLYLGYKPLSEIPALLLGILSVLAFLHSLRAQSGLPWALMAGVLALLSSLGRMDGAILLIAFILSAWIAAVSKRKWLYFALAAGYAFVACTILLIVAGGLNPFDRFIPSEPIDAILPHYDRFSEPDIEMVLTPSKSDVIPVPKLLDVYFSEKLRVLVRILIGFGFLTPLMLCSLARLRHPKVKMVWMWLILVILPSVVLLSGFYEIRYAYLSIVPASILAYFGLVQLHEWKIGHRPIKLNNLNQGWAILLGIICLSSLLVVPYFEIGIDSRNLNAALSHINTEYEDPVVLVASARYGDYAYVRYVWPDMSVRAAQTFNRQGQSVDQVMKYVWKQNYVGTVDQLRSISGKPYLLCQNRPTQDTLTKRLLTPLTFSGHGGLTPCQYTWMWQNQDILRDHMTQFGPYDVYSIEVN